MKDTIKTSRTAGYLEKIFRAINADWFGGELEEPIITIQSTPRAYGHVTVSKIWKSKGEERRHELNIGTGTRFADNLLPWVKTATVDAGGIFAYPLFLSKLRGQRKSPSRRAGAFTRCPIPFRAEASGKAY